MNILRIRRDIFLECNVRGCRASAALDRDFHGVAHGVAVDHFLKVGGSGDLPAVQRYDPVPRMPSFSAAEPSVTCAT